MKKKGGSIYDNRLIKLTADDDFDHFKRLNFSDESSHDDEDLRSNSSQSDPVEDKGDVVYKIMLMYGIGMLVPWSVILSILDYLSS